MTIKNLRQRIEGHRARSAWDRAVKVYALELLEDWSEQDEIQANFGNHLRLLNGATDWHQYSWGGCSLCYDLQIAERTCTPSELKKTKGGQRRPNSREEWLDVQARALYQAELLISKLVEEGD